VTYGRDYTDAAGEPLPYPVVKRMSGVQPEAISWLWPGYFARGKLHVIDGDPGLGKSTMTLDLAARVTTGKPWPDESAGTRPGGVLLVSAEDGLADTIRPRLDAAGADVDRVYALTGIAIPQATGEIDERMPSLPNDIARMEDIIGEYGITLVVIDPLMAYLGPDINSYKDQDVRRALAPLARVAENTSCAVGMVRHLNKAAGASVLYRGGGSIGIVGAARFGFTVGRDPEDPTRRVLANSKVNLAIEPASLGFRLVDAAGAGRVEWEGIVTHTAEDLLRGDGDEDRSERDAAADWLRHYLINGGGEAGAAEIFKEGRKLGFEKHTLQRARKRAGARTRKSAYARGWVWELATEDDTEGDEGDLTRE
jgi:hypothetical protein